MGIEADAALKTRRWTTIATVIHAQVRKYINTALQPPTSTVTDGEDDWWGMSMCLRFAGLVISVMDCVSCIASTQNKLVETGKLFKTKSTLLPKHICPKIYITASLTVSKNCHSQGAIAKHFYLKSLPPPPAIPKIGSETFVRGIDILVPFIRLLHWTSHSWLAVHGSDLCLDACQ